MVNFVEAKFKYLNRFQEFGWMCCLTTQHSVYENMLRAFFNNATLEDASEEAEDPCEILEINTSVTGVPIRVTQAMVATVFDMPDEDLDNEHDG